MEAHERILCDMLAGRAEVAEWTSLSAVEWSELLRVAEREGVGPLLYWALERLGVAKSPEGERSNVKSGQVAAEVRAWLRAAFYSNAARNVLIYGELARARRALEVQAIPAVVLKGPALAAAVYPHLGLRPIGDLDLLVPEAALARAAEAVRGLGYLPEAAPEPARGLRALVSQEENFAGGQALPLRLELHWSLVAGEGSLHRPAMAWFWARTERVSLPEGQATILTPTAHLLFLAAHLGLQHGGVAARLRWLADLHYLITGAGARIEWPALVAAARDFRWAAGAHLALEGAQTCFGTPLPQGLLAALAEASHPEDTQRMRQLADPEATRTQRMLAKLGSLRPAARARLLLATLFPTPAFMRYRYRPRPAWAWPLCYPYRWWTALADAAATMVRGWRGR
ncbi:MAG: nucleotidyltransferase family protein [Chloroflexi bacterium]|nr:nucleotidyltransferase family protein [Chloroflexota bacterium]